MKLFKLKGFLKKEKKVDVIWIISDTKENAILEVEKFANEIEYISEQEVPAWDNFALAHAA